MTVVWQYDVYALLLFFAASLSAGLALLMLRRLRFPDAAAFTVLLLMIAEWSLTDGLEYVSADLPSILFWDRAIYVGAAIVPVAFFVFVLLYTGRGKRLSVPLLLLLCFVPAVTVLLRWTNETYHLFYSGYSLVTYEGLSILQVSFGGGFYVYAAYSYALVLFGIALLVQQFLGSRVLRRQSAILIISALIPVAASVLDLLPNVVFPFDWTPLAFAFTGLISFWGVFRIRLFEFMPLAREAIVRGMGDGVIVLDSGNRIVDINPACEKMFGCGVEVLGTSAVEFFESRGLNGECLAKESSEIVLAMKGVQRYFDLDFSSLRDKRGALMGRIGVMRDITERKQMEETLLQSQRLAVIGELAAMVGHDLRNPLQGIIGAAYLIRKQLRDAPDPSTEKMLALIDNGVEYANGIINDLLEFSREIRLQPVPTTPKSVVRRTLEAVKVPDNVTIKDTTADAPEFFADELKIKRALLNLIQNAIDAMPDGGELSICSMDTQREVSISVADTGVGIPQDLLEKIWHTLYTTKAKGMGLGLPICRRIVEAHHGSISVESTVGKGTTFTLKLPIQPVQAGGEPLWVKAKEAEYSS